MKSFMALCILLCSATVGSLLAQPETRIRQVDVQHFDRFWRVSLYLNRPTKFAVEDRQPRFLTLKVDARTADSLAVPQNEAVLLDINPASEGTNLTVDLPQPFKSDVFYFPPTQKVVLDCYPVFPYPTATRSYEMARRALLQQDTTRAILLFRTALLQDPHLQNAVFRLGEIYLARSELAAARRALAQIDSTARIDLQMKARALLDSLSAPEPEAPPPAVAGAADPDSSTVADESAVAAAKVDSVSSPRAADVVTKIPPQPIIVARRKLPTGPFAWLQKLVAECGVVALVPLLGVTAAVGFFFWFLAMRWAQPGQRREEKHAEHVQELLEKNPVYQRQRALRQKATPGTRAAEKRARVDLREASEASPFVRTPTAHRSAEERLQRIRMRAASRPPAREEEAGGGRKGRSLKREVVRLALKGKTVTEIARELDIGVGEVELILGFGASAPAGSTADDAIDFGT